MTGAPALLELFAESLNCKSPVGRCRVAHDFYRLEAEFIAWLIQE
jgi:hypothetical protein